MGRHSQRILKYLRLRISGCACRDLTLLRNRCEFRGNAVKAKQDKPVVFADPEALTLPRRCAPATSSSGRGCRKLAHHLDLVGRDGAVILEGPDDRERSGHEAPGGQARPIEAEPVGQDVQP